jgi:iron complex outermembrane receptor protein
MDYAWRDKVYYTFETPASVAQGNTLGAVTAQNEANRLGAIPSYGLLNARFAVNFDHPNIELALWARNLTGQQYYTEQFDSYTGLGTVVDYQGDPRTIGGTIKYRW